MAYRIDKTTLRRLLLTRHDYRPSIRRLFREAGIPEQYRGNEIWPNASTETVAAHLGLHPDTFASKVTERGRPTVLEAKSCPKALPLPDDLRQAIEQAAAACGGQRPGAWAMRVLREASEVTLGGKQ